MSRTTILTAIRQAQGVALPSPHSLLRQLKDQTTPANLADFIALLDLIGARVVQGKTFDEAILWIRENTPVSASIASTVPEVPGNFDLTLIQDPHDLNGIHTAIIQARFGVCENGAVWLDETDLQGHRVLPFIAEHLFILLKADALVPNMHQAYEQISQIHSGLGLFLAGPSKTADIEQCLVIGAHGARGATVFIMG